MSSSPMPHNPQAEPENAITNEQWWALFASLQGSATKQLEDVGGADAWFEYLRHGDEES